MCRVNHVILLRYLNLMKNFIENCAILFLDYAMRERAKSQPAQRKCEGLSARERAYGQS